MSTILHGCLPDTTYFEITARSGNQYGVWVTTPPGYAESAEPLPLVYVVDGNWSVGLTAPLIVTQADPFLTVEPYVQVTVGFAGDEAADWAQLRNRDLVPPGEPVSEEMVATVTSARETGAMTAEHADAYLAMLADTHADVFLDFLTEELHPRLQSELRVTESGHGLFGYSYGGLFALYAWLRGGTPFATFGAGTPGVASTESEVFTMLDALPDRGPGSTVPRLHVTLNEIEIFGHLPIYRRLARTVLSVLDQLHGKGLADAISSEVLRETHVTGLQASFLSYLTACRTSVQVATVSTDA